MSKLSEICLLVWNISGAEALSANFQYIEKEHLLIAFTEIDKLLDITSMRLNFSPEQIVSIRNEYNIIATTFDEAEIDGRLLRQHLREALGEGKHSSSRGDIKRSPETKRVFEKAIAASDGPATGLMLLRTIMEKPGSTITKALSRQKISHKRFLDVIKEKTDKEFLANINDQYIPAFDIKFIREMGIDLVEQASKKFISPCVGRVEEFTKLLATLLNPEAKVPLLIGDDGVGKSVLVDNLAVKIWEKKEVPALAGKTIVEINLKAFTEVDTLETAIDNFNVFLEDITKTQSAIIYFSDLVPLLLWERSNPFLANLPFKTALSRQHISCICAVTPQQYRDYISKDIALLNAFEPIEVKEPAPLETLEILKELRPKLELHAGLKITDKALAAAIRLGTAFRIPGAMPKKAVTIISIACNKATAPLNLQPTEYAQQFETAAKKYSVEIQGDVNEMRVVEAVSGMTGETLDKVASKLNHAPETKILDLPKKLHEGIIGQNVAVECVASVISNSPALKGDTSAPLVMMFIGYSGSGKTQLAQNVAKALYGASDSIIKVNAAALVTDDDIRDFFGTNFSEGHLDALIKEAPRSIVVIDSVHKAKPLFFQFFSGFIDKDRINTKDLSGMVFILLSDPFPKTAGRKTAEQSPEREMLARARKILPEVFLEKIDELIVFNPLTLQTATTLLLRWIEEIRVQLNKEFGVDISISRAIERKIIEKGLVPDSGAKHLRAAFESILVAPIQDLIDTRKITTSNHWRMQTNGTSVVMIAKPKAMDESANIW